MTQNTKTQMIFFYKIAKNRNLPKVSKRIHLFCPHKFTFYIHKNAATCSAPQNDRLNLSFVKDIHVHSWQNQWPEMVEKRQLVRVGGGGYHNRQSSVHHL